MYSHTALTIPRGKGREEDNLQTLYNMASVKILEQEEMKWNME